MTSANLSGSHLTTHTLSSNIQPMIIRTEQLWAFDDSDRAHFLAELIEHLKTDFGEMAGKDDQEIRAFVEEQIERAAGYGVELEDDVETYIELAAEYGPEFDRDNAAFQEVLSNGVRSGSEKVDILEELELFHERPVE